MNVTRMDQLTRQQPLISFKNMSFRGSNVQIISIEASNSQRQKLEYQKLHNGSPIQVENSSLCSSIHAESTSSIPSGLCNLSLPSYLPYAFTLFSRRLFRPSLITIIKLISIRAAVILKVISEEHATESTHTSASSPPERGLFRGLNNCDPEA